MPVPFQLLRAILGILATFFGYMLGRSAAGAYHGKVRQSRVYAWLIRLLFASFAIAWRHDLDAVMVASIVAAALAAGAGVWTEFRPSKQ